MEGVKGEFYIHYTIGTVLVRQVELLYFRYLGSGTEQLADEEADLRLLQGLGPQGVEVVPEHRRLVSLPHIG